MPDNISEILLEVGKTLGETAFMCSIALVIAIVAGGALGILLYASSTHLFINSPLLNKVLGATVNVVRSIPFLILLIFLLPLSALVVGTKIGTEAVVIPLAVAAVAFFARLSEASLAEVDKGMIEAAFASGAGKLRTMFCIVLPEAHVPLVKDITITAISLLGFSAMAGLVGGGGLGDLAYRYGYQRYNMGIMIACIAVLVVLVQIIQAAGDWYVNQRQMRADEFVRLCAVMGLDMQFFLTPELREELSYRRKLTIEEYGTGLCGLPTMRERGETRCNI